MQVQNPMLVALNQNKAAGIVGQLKGMKKQIDALRSLGNPQLALNQLIANNPQMKQAYDYVQANGGNAKEVCLKLARERGLDPQSIMDALK